MWNPASSEAVKKSQKSNPDSSDFHTVTQSRYGLKYPASLVWTGMKVKYEDCNKTGRSVNGVYGINLCLL